MVHIRNLLALIAAASSWPWRKHPASSSMGSALAAVRPAARSKVKATVADGAINRARGGQRRSTNVESTEAGTDSEAIRRWVGVDVDRTELEMSECSDTPARLRIETYDAHGGMDCAPSFRRLDAPGV